MSRKKRVRQKRFLRRAAPGRQAPASERPDGPFFTLPRVRQKLIRQGWGFFVAGFLARFFGENFGARRYLVTGDF
jgi:hypothetical protein